MKRQAKVASYVRTHNKVLEKYQKNIRFILFIPLLNILGVVLTMFAADFRFSTCLESNLLIFRELASYNFANIELFYLACLGVTLPFLLPFIFLFMPAKNGKVWALYTTIFIYVADLVLLFIYADFETALSEYLFRVGVHIIILIFLFLAIFNYHALFAIARKYKTTPLVTQKSLAIDEKQ